MKKLTCILAFLLLAVPAFAQQTVKQTITVTINPSPLVVTTTAITATSGTAASGTIAVSGGVAPYTCTLDVASAPLPAGMTINSNCSYAIASTSTAASASIIVDVSDSSGHSVSLNWQPSPTPAVTGYNLYRGTTSGGPYAKITTLPVTGLSLNDLAVAAGQEYCYVATAVDAAGESVYSNQACATVP